MARSRRGRGEGSIYQRADGRWCASVSAGYNAQGKRHRKVVYGETKEAVREKLRNVDPASVSADTSKLTVEQFLLHWLDNTISKTVTPSTGVRYRTVVNHQLVPILGQVRLSKLVPLHIEQLYQTLGQANASPRTQQLAGIVLGSAMRHAVRVRLIATNPVRDIPKPRVARREMKVWNETQVKAFIKATRKDRLHALYVTALGTGARQGELFALQWSDVDFTAGTLTIQRNLDETRGKFVVKEPKTGRGRTVHLPAFATKALNKHRAAMLKEGNLDAPIFCDPRGGYLRKSNVQRRSFDPLILAAKLPKIRFHDLRHCHATMLLLAGENVKTISERLGHSSIQITLDTYAHVLPSMQQGAASKLNRLLG